MAYFIPDPLAMDHIVAAIKRGVRVRILLPGSHTDSRLVRAASRSYWGRILEAGGEIYEYQPTMFHCKVLVVDGLWTSVGSTNFDSRSFRLNDEANLNVMNARFAAGQIAVFETDKGRSRPITYDQFCARCERQGRSQHVFSRVLHPGTAEVATYCQVGDAERRWRQAEQVLALRVELVHQLEAELVADPGDDDVRSRLHGLYRWTFDAFKLKGIAAAAAGAPLGGPAT